MSIRQSHPGAQHGAAILTAMLTLVLVTVLASNALWLHWRNVEIEIAERSRNQLTWELGGALDWARLILHEDARSGDIDHFAEPWAIPLAPTRLSTFSGADSSATQPPVDTQEEIFLTWQITDLQSRMNVTNLMLDGKLYEPSRLAFARLFELLDLPATDLAEMINKLQQAQNTEPASTPKPGQTAENPRPLLPQEFDQLVWLGLSLQTMKRLRPFVTLLPMRTPINLNTAPAEVIYSCVEAFNLADAQRLVKVRSQTHLETLNDALKMTGNATAELTEGQHSVNTRFFEVRSQLRLDQAMVQEISVVQRDGLDVRTLWRQRRMAPDD